MSPVIVGIVICRCFGGLLASFQTHFLFLRQPSLITGFSAVRAYPFEPGVENRLESNILVASCTLDRLSESQARLQLVVLLCFLDRAGGQLGKVGVALVRRRDRIQDVRLRLS